MKSPELSKDRQKVTKPITESQPIIILPVHEYTVKKVEPTRLGKGKQRNLTLFNVFEM